MICPKCSDIMRTYERNGVHVEQCAACKGIFLDRGELEQLAAAERHHYAAEAGEAPLPPAVPPPPYQPPPGAAPPPRDLYGAPRERAPYDWLDERDHRSSDPYRGERHRDEDRYRYDDRHRYDDRRYKKRKKKDFLDVLFDL